MAVKARFRCTGYTAGQITREAKDADGNAKQPREFETVEVRTPEFMAVYDTTPGNPNHQFWAATPSGKITLQTINESAWRQFEMGKVYDVTFTEAPPEAQ